MKRLIYIILAFCTIIFTLNAEEIQSSNVINGRPKVAVVLAGGGAKGTAHLGVLKVIEECGIPIDMIVGTSMGAIVGGLYSIGYTSEEILDIVKNTDWINLILDTPDYGNTLLTSKKDQENYLLRLSLDRARVFSGTSRGGIIHGRNITALMEQLTDGIPKHSDFNKFPIAFACVATDAVTGEKHVFHDGNLVTAMRSSMAIPSVFTPVKLNEMALVDGGIVDNYPVDVARDMGADIVIGLDLVSEVSDTEIANSALDVLMSMLDLISKNRYQTNINNTDLYIPVNTTGYNAASFSTTAIDTLISRGEEAGRKMIGELQALSKRLEVNPEKKCHARLESLNYTQNLENIHSKSFVDKQDTIPENVKNAFQRGTLSIGGRFDNHYYASLQFAVDVRLHKRRHVDLNLYGRLGSRMVGGISIAQAINNSGKIEGSYTIEHKDLDIYFKGQRILSVVNYHQRFNISYKQEWRRVGYSFGTLYDIDRYRNLLIHRDVINVTGNMKQEKYVTYYGKAEFNNLNSMYFPTRGTQVEGKVEFITSNLYNFHSEPPLMILTGNWRTAFSITPTSVIIPHGAIRYIGSGDATIPWALNNFVGGLHREMWKEQQMEMAGMPNMEIVNRKTIGVFGIEFQQRISKNNFLVLSADGSSMSNGINEVLGERGLFYGVNLGYQYRGIAGPISLTGMWSSRTEEFGAVLNIGYYF